MKFGSSKRLSTSTLFFFPQVLSEDNVKDIVRFAQEKSLFVFADEVYQDNVYADGCKFHSFKRVRAKN